MQIEYKISLDDYSRSNQIWMRNASFVLKLCSWIYSWPLIVIGALIIAFGIFRTLSWHPEGSSGVWVLPIGFFLLLQPYLYRRMVKKRYKMQKLSSIFRIQTSETGIEVTRVEDDTDTRYGWKAFDKYMESESLFVVMVNKLTFLPFPKASLTPDQQTELRALLAAHIPSK